MEHQPTSTQNHHTDFDHRVVPFPTRDTPHVPAEFPAKPATHPQTAPRARVRTRAIGQVAVLEVAGSLDDVVEELDLAIQLALAESPRGVVCDLSSVPEGTQRGAVEVLATAGRHVRDWPGIPVAVACSNPRFRDALRVQPLGGHLITAESVSCAMSSVLATPHLIIRSLHLAAHPTAPHAAHNFVTRTLLGWRRTRIIPFASLLVSQLVASSSVHAGTAIDLSVVWDRGALRLSVGDHGPAQTGQPPAPKLHGRGLTVLAGLSRAFGVLPAAGGGGVVWAVLEAPMPSPSAGKHMSNVRPGQVKAPASPKRFEPRWTSKSTCIPPPLSLVTG
jgi:hypothetical protein